MGALALHAAPARGPSAAEVAALSPVRLVALARSYGLLRAVEPHQAAVVRAAAVYDRSVLPRWQRAGDGVHAWCAPRDYATGRTWVRRTLGPVPGATGRTLHGRVEVQARRPHVQWRTREHWTEVIVPAVIAERPEALVTRRGRVTADTFLLWARTIAQHAHDRTGRRCVVRVDRLAELMQVHKSTVQRCQLAAEALGLYVVLEPGRMLTEEETYAARRRGSRQRGMANDAALVVPSWVGSDVVDEPPPPRPELHPRRRLTVDPVENRPQRPRSARGARTGEQSQHGCDTPTRGRPRKPSSSPSTGSFRTEQRSAGKSEPPPAARHREERRRKSASGHPPAPSGPQRPATGTSRRPQRIYDPDALQLARNLVERLSWLRGIAPGRLEPGLRRFIGCATPWTAGDVLAAIDAANRRLGRASMTADRIKHPPALLASYLRDFDPDADHPDSGHDFARSAPVSQQTYRNRVLLEHHRESVAAGGAAQTPAVAAATAAMIREDLRRRRGGTTEPAHRLEAPPT